MGIDPVARYCSILFFRFAPTMPYHSLSITSYDYLSVPVHISLSLAFPHSHPCQSFPPFPIPCLCIRLSSGLGAASRVVEPNTHPPHTTFIILRRLNISGHDGDDHA